MPVNQLVNPLAEEGESASYGAVVEYFQYDPAQSGNLVNGNLVSMEALTAPSTGPVLIKKSTTTPDLLFVGIVVNAPTGGYTPGSAVAVLVKGVALALFDANNTTAGQIAIQSSTTAGTCTEGTDAATVQVGTVVGIILESVTIGSGTALVPLYVNKM